MFAQRTDKYKYFVCLFLLLTMSGMAEIGHASSQITTPSSCPATLTQGSVGVAYSYTFAGNGGTTWSITSGSLPPGLSLNATSGVLSGTPTTPGTYTFTIRLNASWGTSATCACTLKIAGCSFVGGISNGIISFGNIDPSSTSTIYGNVNQQVSFTCLLGTAYTITVTPSSGWTLTSGSNTISYTLGVASSGTYSGTAVNLLIAPPSTSSSSITPANFQNAPAGTYTSTSAVSISVAYGTGSLTLPGGILPGCHHRHDFGGVNRKLEPWSRGTLWVQCRGNDWELRFCLISPRPP